MVTQAAQPKFSKEFVDCLMCGKRDAHGFHHKLPNVVQCVCGLVYANPRLKEKCLKDLYSREYFESNASEKMGYDNYVSDRELVEKTFRQRLEGLEKKWLKKKGKVLDVGCATGFFLCTARALGWSVSGVEISDYCCEYAKREFGLDLFNGQFKDLDASTAGAYDLITMWDYVEHSFTPGRDIKKAWELLEPGGIFALATPDIGSLPAKIFQQNWVGFKEHEHLYYFTKKNLCDLLKKKGFTILKTSYVGKYVSLSFFAKRLTGYFRGIGQILIQIANRPFFSKVNFYCNPYDIVYVVCQKPLRS